MTAGSIPEAYVEEFKRRGFLLESRIGSGLSGNVFKARQLSLDRDVAIKVKVSWLAIESVLISNTGRTRRRANWLGANSA